MSHAAPPRHTRDAQAIHALQGGRLDIAKALAEGPLTLSELSERLGLSQSAISKHMKIMLYAGLVERRRGPSRRTWPYRPYELVHDAFPPLAALFARLAEPPVEGDSE